VPSPSDIVVVGAGVVGCAVAYELARRGASVEILDDRPAGQGATQASAGMLAPFIEARDGGPLLELTARGLERFDDFVAGVTADGGVPIRYQRAGSLEVAFDEQAEQTLEATARALDARGIAHELLGASATIGLEPALSPRVRRGLLIPVHGAVAASDLTRALVAAARRHGAQVIEHGRARRVFANAAEVTVETDRGSLSGDAVVIAAGSWAAQIEIGAARARVPVKPVRGQLLQLTWTGAPPGRVVWSDRCYIVPWSDGTVLVGATVEDVGFDERTTVEGIRGLLDAACDVLPECASAALTATRAGLRPHTPDHLPIIGWSSALGRVMYATGHYRNGVLLAPLTAELVARAMLDGVADPVLAWTAASRFGDL
jgi:glycine oxidase